MGPGEILRLEGFWFLALLAAMVVYRMLTGAIRVNGLLTRKDGTNATSPERVQLLLATLAVAIKYVGDAAHGTGGALPDISRQWLYVMGGSSGLYASVKALTTLKSK